MHNRQTPRRHKQARGRLVLDREPHILALGLELAEPNLALWTVLYGAGKIATHSAPSTKRDHNMRPAHMNSEPELPDNGEQASQIADYNVSFGEGKSRRLRTQWRIARPAWRNALL